LELCYDLKKGLREKEPFMVHTCRCGWVYVFLSVWAPCVYAQSPVLPGQLQAISESFGEERVALVIGNAHYEAQGFSLDNTESDAQLMTEALENVDFEVEMGLSLTGQAMLEAIERFGSKLTSETEMAIFYFAGHGVQIDGENYLLPTNLKQLSKEEIIENAIPLSRVTAAMDKLVYQPKIIILDACRNNPFVAQDKSTKGLAEIATNPGTQIFYSAQPGAVAFDGGDRGNSVFTRELARFMGWQYTGSNLEAIGRAVTRQVLVATQGQQQPWLAGSTSWEVKFRKWEWFPNAVGVEDDLEPKWVAIGCYTGGIVTAVVSSIIWGPELYKADKSISSATNAEQVGFYTGKAETAQGYLIISLGTAAFFIAAGAVVQTLYPEIEDVGAYTGSENASVTPFYNGEHAGLSFQMQLD
jgi:hypothetical protein